MTGPRADAMQRLDATIHGRVQGVGFRIHAARFAEELGLTGWVTNESRGSVRCVAEGHRDALATLLEGLREGPRGAIVDRVDVTWTAATGEFSGFTIRSGWHGGD
jgi:acylphosphatase